VGLSKNEEAFEISMVIPEGNSKSILQALFEKKIYRANVSSARGYVETESRFHITKYVVKDILTVIVEKERSDEIFAFLYEFVNKKEGHGIMYMAQLGLAHPFGIPSNLPTLAD